MDAVDDAARLGLTLVLELTAQGLVRQRAVLTNDADDVFSLDGLLLTLPVPAVATELLDFTGRWARERSPQRTAFTHGTRLRENRRGRTGYDAAFVLVAGTAGFANRTGEVWGLHTAWSGNHRSLAERSHYHPGLLGGGELLGSGEVRLGRGESYTSPWVYGSWGVGLDALAGRFHAWMRARPQHPRSPRPVTLNTWEAVYFQHDLGRLTALADAAAAVGAERFVLDDGWFGDRRDDTRALGDWYVSADVWPDGLHPLVEHVTGLGLQFGLWVEPEMVNPDSDLARAHPDWMLRVPSRLPREARHQQVLDLAVPEAYAYILERLDALLTEYPIGYLKWDHNRDLVDAGHGGAPGRARADARRLPAARRAARAAPRRRDRVLLLGRGARRPGDPAAHRPGVGQRLHRRLRAAADPAVDQPADPAGAHRRAHRLRHGAQHRPSARPVLPGGDRAVRAPGDRVGPAGGRRGAAGRPRPRGSRSTRSCGRCCTPGRPCTPTSSTPSWRCTAWSRRTAADALYAVAMTGRSTSTSLPRVTLPGLDPDALYDVRPQAPGDAVDHAPAWWTPRGRAAARPAAVRRRARGAPAAARAHRAGAGDAGLTTTTGAAGPAAPVVVRVDYFVAPDVKPL